MKKMWIDNDCRASGSGRAFTVVNPATEEPIEDVARGDAADAEAAAEAAFRAKGRWAVASGLERGEHLHEAARRIRERRDELARLLTMEGGKPLIENRDEVEWVAACFDYYAEIGRDQKGRTLSPVFEHQINFVVKEPYGVAVCIVPWNYPLLLLSWKVAPALAAGCTVVAKPSEYTPLSTLMLAECLDHLPRGVFNVVVGYGPEVGEPLVTSAKTDVVAFTGSVTTGRRIAALAAERIKKINLELGGNDPFIVCDDVDLDVAVRAAAWAAFLNNGQVCTSAERFYVFERIADAFTEKLVAFTRGLRLGNPLGPDVDLGPMISDRQRQKVEAKIHEARAQGAQVLCGGRRPERFVKGFYLEPAVLANCHHGMALFKEETFGPVLPIVRVKDIDEAIALADDSAYGLGASILTRNLEYAMKAMEGVKAGTFWINDPLTDNDAGPFGGMRMSGFGRELGAEGLEAFRDTKHVHLDYKLEKKGYWFPYDWSGGRKTD
jgi:betaine-aldehyde dehydrogenase